MRVLDMIVMIHHGIFFNEKDDCHHGHRNFSNLSRLFIL